MRFFISSFSLSILQLHMPGMEPCGILLRVSQMVLQMGKMVDGDDACGDGKDPKRVEKIYKE
jgi:hypothetical protein